MADPKDIALEAVAKMRTERGDNALFSSDEIWSFAASNVPSERRPSTIVWLSRNGHIVRTGKMRNAASQARAGSKTPEYRFGSSDSTAIQSHDLAHILGYFDDACEGILQVRTGHSTRIASALLAKRFLILTGLAGSGKTKVAQAFSHWISESDTCHQIIPVGADWTGSENIIGYPNGLAGSMYSSKPSLSLILRAIASPDIPHFLILDEMNLSHVERYFAEIPSSIESNEEIVLYDGEKRNADNQIIPDRIRLPGNLFVIGTVNVDETTYMFSPKVLDRANVIEFRMDDVELAAFLQNPTRPNLLGLDGKGASFGRAFVEAAKSEVTIPNEAKNEFDTEVLLLFRLLQPHGAEFGYRTAYEASRFIYFYKLLSGHLDAEDAWFDDAFDCVICQKLLPKLHGSRAKLGPLLKKLWFICTNDVAARGNDPLKAADEAARSTNKNAEPSVVVPEGAPYPLSAEKIGRMWRLLIENGFASFAEA